jgi:hypothetical protein
MDVFVLGEAKSYDAWGGRWMLQVADMLESATGQRMTGYLCPSGRSTHHNVIYISDKLRPLQHWNRNSPDVHHHFVSTLTCAVDGLSVPLNVLAEHWSPFDGDVRLASAKLRGNWTAPSKASVPMGYPCAA